MRPRNGTSLIVIFLMISGRSSFDAEMLCTLSSSIFQRLEHRCALACLGQDAEPVELTNDILMFNRRTIPKFQAHSPVDKRWIRILPRNCMPMASFKPPPGLYRQATATADRETSCPHTEQEPQRQP